MYNGMVTPGVTNKVNCHGGQFASSLFVIKSLICMKMKSDENSFVLDVSPEVL